MEFYEFVDYIEQGDLHCFYLGKELKTQYYYSLCC